MQPTNQQLAERVANLEKQMAAFNQPNTIPIQFERSLTGRGFVNESSIVTGLGTTDGGGTEILIPGATSYSIAMVTLINSASEVPIYGEMAPSSTNPNQWALYVSSIAAFTIFSYVVFNLNQKPQGFDDFI